MANLVNLEAVHKTFGTVTVLDEVSLGIANGERIGIVGRNGGGKSTLLGVLAGRLVPDAGRVTQAGDATVGWLSQGDELHPEGTVLATVVGTGPEHTWATDPQVRSVLEGLLADISAEALVGSLSGGERRRVALAALLVARPSLLLLDEPTNHLDIEAIAWLADRLDGYRGAVVVVTHDRWFLDAVCTQTWEVGDGSLRRYDGGYAAYVLARAERERQEAASEERRRNLLRKELAWLRRGPPARTSKPKFRIDAANALIAGEPAPRDSVELQRFAASRLGKDVVELLDVTVRLGERELLSGVTWRLGPGDRVGILGRNGAGKTTLLRTLSGEQAVAAGRVKQGRTVVEAVLSQEVAELPADRRVLQAVEDVAERVVLGKGREATASQLLERLGFPAARQWTPVGDLSGGERRRLQLLRLLMAGPNVLLLDEPTNDLDVETLTQLEDLLDGWGGSLVVISHDRWFLERVCDSLWALPGDGSLRHLPGGVEEYLQLPRATAASSARPPAVTGPSDAARRRDARRQRQRIERRLEKIEQQESALHEQLAEHATDFERIMALDAQVKELARERSELEDEWMVVAEDDE